MSGRQDRFIADATEGNGVQEARPPLSMDAPQGRRTVPARTSGQDADGGNARSRCLPPTDCTRIIIVGAGGFGREVLQWARDAWPEHAGKIAGLLSADPGVLEGRAIGLPILGSPDDFTPQPGDGLLLGIGRRDVRRRVAEQLESRGGHFLSLIHPSAIVADTADVGRGTILCPYASVTANARLGAFCLLNLYSMVAHDAAVGAFSVLSPYAGVAGEAAVGENVFLAMHAFVGPGVEVGDHAVISGCSCALHRVPAGTLVYGVPGRHTFHMNGMRGDAVDERGFSG